MASSIKLVAIIAGLLGATALAAQDLSVEEIKARIQAQIRANEVAQQANPDGSLARTLQLNNHQDVNEPLYPGRPTVPSSPPAVTAPPDATIALNFQIAFELNSDRLGESARPTLLKIAAALADPMFSRKVFLVVGHTDNLGNPIYNRVLSERRASRVVTALEALGVPARQLSPLGVGMTQPLPDLPEADPRNRRVEVRLLS